MAIKYLIQLRNTYKYLQQSESTVLESRAKMTYESLWIIQINLFA